MHDLACVIHVHSTYSDGTATVPEIVAAARASGTDAVLLTDHDTLAARDAGWEGWHDGVLVLVGTEISPRGGHFLAFGLEHALAHEGLSEHEICAAVAAEDALGFPAHPFSTGSAIAKSIGRPHPWRALDDCEFTGIELWSLVTDTAEGCSTLRELAAFLRRPESSITEPPRANLARWDRLCQTRRVVAIGGLDAHQTGFRLAGRPVSPHPHEVIFRTLRTHVLTDAEPSRDTVYAALRRGRCYLALDSLAPATGFAFWAAGEGGELQMGDEAPARGWMLHARLPRRAQLTLMRGGRPVYRAHTDSLRRRVDQPGVFRIEAELDGRTWILSNPIYLR